MPLLGIMKLEKQNTVETISAELVRRIVQKRLDFGWTQSKAAEQAGIAIRTLRRLELGEDCHFSTIIRLLSAYGLTDRLDQLVPEPTVSPIEFVERQKKTKQRASKALSKGKNQPWKWGDEQ